MEIPRKRASPQEAMKALTPARVMPVMVLLLMVVVAGLSCIADTGELLEGDVEEAAPAAEGVGVDGEE